MILGIIMLIFGIIALTKGEFKITNKRKVSGGTGKILGVLLLVGAIPIFWGVFQIIIFAVVILIGLIKAENIDASSPTPKNAPPDN